MRLSRVCCHLHTQNFSVRKWGGFMVESYLIYTIYILFYALVGVTIINIALIIALAILLSKQ